MHQVTKILESVESGDLDAAEQLFPIVYDELRKIAISKMSGESTGHTLQATALVHEAWLRLLGSGRVGWQNRAHFFGSAAEAMRRVLVDHARRKQSLKRWGGLKREEIHENHLVLAVPSDEVLAVSDALDALALEDPTAAELVKLRYFVGLTMEEAASGLGLGKRTAENIWTFARVWLKRRISARF